jgi:YHS domain-containing protein
MRFILINFGKLLLLVVLIMVIRAVFGYVARAMGNMASPAASRASAAGQGKGGELKKDPVCGVFVSAQSSVKKTIDGEIMHFCSAACRDKFRAA